MLINNHIFSSLEENFLKFHTMSFPSHVLGLLIVYRKYYNFLYTSNPRTCERNVWNFLLVKMWLLISIHFAWHQVTIIIGEGEGGGGLGHHGPSPRSATGLIWDARKTYKLGHIKIITCLSSEASSKIGEGGRTLIFFIATHTACTELFPLYSRVLAPDLI